MEERTLTASINEPAQGNQENNNDEGVMNKTSCMSSRKLAIGLFVTATIILIIGAVLLGLGVGRKKPSLTKVSGKPTIITSTTQLPKTTPKTTSVTFATTLPLPTTTTIATTSLTTDPAWKYPIKFGKITFNPDPPNIQDFFYTTTLYINTDELTMDNRTMLDISIYRISGDKLYKLTHYAAPYCQWFDRDVLNFPGMPGYYPPIGCPLGLRDKEKSVLYGPHPVRLKQDFEASGYGPITPGRYLLQIWIHKRGKILMDQWKVLDLVDIPVDEFS